jgi:hypothetical protein
MPKECAVNCLDNPDGVDKKDWKCSSCGTNLEQAHNEKQKRSATFHKNIKEIEAKAVVKATEAYSKVFSETMASEEKQL